MATAKSKEESGFLSVAVEALKRLTHQGLLYAVVLFAIAVAAVLILVGRPGIPWWIQASIALLLMAFACAMAYALAHPFRKTNLPYVSPETSLGAVHKRLRKELIAKSETELSDLVASLHIAPFPPDRTNVTRRINYVIASYPVEKLQQPKRDTAKIICFGAAGLLLIPLWTWYRGLPTAQEKVIREYFDGINGGVRGDSNGWGQAWSALSKGRQDLFRNTHPGAYPENLQSLYDTHHSIRSINYLGLGPEEDSLFMITYETREVVFPNRLNRWLRPRPRSHVDAFYKQLPTSKQFVEAIIEDVEQHYEMKSNRKDFAQLGLVQLKEAISDYLVNRLNFEELFRPNLLKVISQAYGLPSKALPPSGHPDLNKQHYDVIWLYDISLIKEDRSWKINKFIPRGAVFREVNPE